MEAVKVKTKSKKPKSKQPLEETAPLCDKEDLGVGCVVKSEEEDARFKSRRRSDKSATPEETERLLNCQSPPPEETLISENVEMLNSLKLNADDESYGTELEEIVPNVDNSSAPPIELASTHFLTNPLSEMRESFDESSSLDSGNVLESNIQTTCANFSINDIEDEFAELSNYLSLTKELPSFTENQLLALYLNEEIGKCESFVDCFVDNELRGGMIFQHPLYELLVNYLRCRDKQTINCNEIDSLLRDCKDIQERLWILEIAKVTETGECQDGNPVEASHEYQVGNFDQLMLVKLTNNLAAIREKVHEQHALYTYSSQVTKLKIDTFIQKLVQQFSNIPHNGPVVLYVDDTTHKTADICMAVSVLFHFQRQMCRDQGFMSETRQWLTNLIAVLLRVSSWKEHLFILNHILRCPGGVAKWAASYIQAPVAPFKCMSPIIYLNHMITMLSAIVSPIKNRELFLSQTEKHLNPSDEHWVLVDSDGEEEEETSDEFKHPLAFLRENDVIVLFNQIPLDSLFRQTFQIIRKDGTDSFVQFSSSQLLKMFAISRHLINIFEEGIATYRSIKYQQFAKRLASVILHTAQYATDAWDVHKFESNDCRDESFMDRLQAEYDNIILCACSAFQATEQKSVLQFLISLPFSLVSLHTLWRLFHMVMQPYKSTQLCKNSVEWWANVEERIPNLSDAELYYILTAVSNMAMARTFADWAFIKMVTVYLLQVGFINTSTRDICYKTCRSLLSNMANKYPSLITVILNKLKHLLPQAGNLTLYIFKDLPLCSWRPTKEDMSLLEHWLLACPLSSIEASLARFILFYMNWGLSTTNSSELFLPREIHCQVALFVVRLAILHCPESTTSSHSTVIADTIKQLTFSSDRSISEQSLSVWVWSMLFKLRLHLMDQPNLTVAVVTNPIQHFSMLPSLESLPNELSPLIRAVKENEVTAIFTSLLMTTTGHSIPLICQNGFKMMSTLMQCHRYLAVLVLLENITPLFLGCLESLLSSEKFHNIVIGLLNADKTFLKFALSLISSDFPGLILKQFGDMMQTQIENYRKKYNLSSPLPLIELWLKVLNKTWIINPTATSYLMDIILRTAFFQPEMKAAASEILVDLLQAHLHSSKQKFSLLNWVSGNNTYGSLMSKSPPETPWFSLFAIDIEQDIMFAKTGLWKEVLVDLSCTSGKASVDSTLKRCCSKLKLSYMPCSTLPIYRWSQQILDTPVDHPVMPIFWQKFFTLYLERMPSYSRKDLGAVGFKFFEGMVNQALFKKLKNKLKDCKSFYESKCNNPTDIVTEEKRTWYDSMAKLYTSLLLWIDDSSGLQEPGVYLPSLPPAFNTKKLSSIFHGEEAIWYEYIDYEGVRSYQRQSALNWELCTCRHLDLSFKPMLSPTEPDALTRMSKRLQKYEGSIPPPPVIPLQSSIAEIPTDALYNKFLLLEILKDPFKALTNYSQFHLVHSGEHSSIDYCLIELVPLLYDTVETNVTLHAACDTHNPGTHVPAMNSLNCAGPAVIRIKVPEVRVNQPVDLAIHNNRIEVQNLIKRSLQTPPANVSASSVLVQQVVRSLEEKYIELKKIGDINLLARLQETGIALFYHMTYFFTDEASTYPPMKQLITTCVETLGQCFISVDENQSPVLLSKLLEAPSLTSLLATHFTPTRSSPQVYIQLYRTLMNAVTASNYDLVFVLLTKFDIALWIETQKPRASDRAILIDLVGQALASAGQNPPQEFIMVHEVLRRQLCVLMMVDAPQHFSHVFTVALKHSESHSLATEVWYDIVNALVWQTGVTFRPHSTLAQVVSNMAKFAVDQTILSLHEAIEISTLFSKHFLSERLQYGLYGLYPKYRVYVSALITFLGTISHALIAATIQRNGVGNNSKVGSELWPHLSGLYSPWICPYYTQSLTQPTAAWIQQLTDDRSILLPWIQADSGHAHKVSAIFTESLRFFLDSCQGPNDVFSQLWQYYVNYFANPSVPEHIMSVINNNLLSLPWNRFTPTLLDLELMLKVSDTYVPFCHTLLGAIFIEVTWSTWLETMLNSNPQQISKIHSSLLHLLIKLSNEPNVRQSGKILDLLRTSKSFHWETIDFPNYESVVNWFVMSYDPKVILNLEDDANQIDLAVMELLRYAAGFVHGESGYHATTPRKRQVYVRGCIKMIISCLSKYKSLVLSNQGKVQGAIEDILILINTVVPQSGGTHAEAGLHIGEVLTLVNLSSGPLSKLCSDTIVSWVSKRGDCIVSAALLRTLGTTLEPTAPLGEIMESTLESVFNDRSGGDWDVTRSHFQEPVPRNFLPEENFTNNNQLLSLYLLITKKLFTQFDLNEESTTFSNITTWMDSMKESIDLETKIVPLFHLTLVMASRLADQFPYLCEKNLKILVQKADNWADYKPSWGFLGAIGLKKQPTLSVRARALCRLFSALVLTQLPERKGELPADQPPFIRTTPHSPGGLTSNNMELGPSSDAIKALAALELSTADKGFLEGRQVLEMSLSFLRKPENSLHNVHLLYLSVAKILYSDTRYIQCISLGT